MSERMDEEERVLSPEEPLVPSCAESPKPVAKQLWDAATFLEGAKTAYDHESSRGMKRYMGWFFIALTQFGVVAAMKYGSVGLLAVSSFLVFYWYTLRWPLRKPMLRRFFERSPQADRELLFSVSEEGICVDGQAVPWGNIVRVLATSRGYLFDMVDSFLYIRKGAFLSSEGREAFLREVRRRVGNVERIDEKGT